eukprot:1882686-Pleurochrysis_carterae.AAC.1
MDRRWQGRPSESKSRRSQLSLKAPLTGGAGREEERALLVLRIHRERERRVVRLRKTHSAHE